MPKDERDIGSKLNEGWNSFTSLNEGLKPCISFSKGVYTRNIVMQNKGWPQIVQEKGRVGGEGPKVNFINRVCAAKMKGVCLAELKHGKPKNMELMADGGETSSQGGKRGEVAREMTDDQSVELFEMKEKVRRLEGEVWAWKERYLATSELVDMYERGQV